MAVGSPLKQRGWLTSSEWTLYWNLLPWGTCLQRKCVARCSLWEGGKTKQGVHSVLVPLFLQTVTVTEVPPGFPLQTHFSFFRFIPFLSLLLSFFSLQTDPCLCPLPVFLFCFWLVCSSKTSPKLHLPPPHPPHPPAPSPLRSLLTCELFQWNIFEFSFISTWLLNLFSCCLYIILILLWFLKFHLYYILGPRDHPDIVDSFMQLQAQVCFWFLISFTLGFSPSSSLLLISLCPFLPLYLSVLSDWALRCPIS